ncbi:MAG: hypothetical protein ACOY3Y_20405 [Acidobacteriota bacterium]
MRGAIRQVGILLAAVLLAPLTSAAQEQGKPRELGLGLGAAAAAQPLAPGAVVTGAGATPAGYSLDLWQLVPPGSSFLTEARLAEWESWSGRQQWMLWRTGVLGPPEFAERAPLFAVSGLGLDLGSDGRPRLTVLGPWSPEWEKLTGEEKFGIVLQEAATLAVLAALLQGLN